MPSTSLLHGATRLRGSTTAFIVALLALSSPVDAQTWIGGATAPSVPELVAIDATGEAGWLYGAEDVAGDGLASFKQQEQSIDVRTAYAAADATRFWVRIYASDTASVGGNVTFYVFIDADRDASTGGAANAPEIDPKLTVDPSPGGYEYVLGVRGNESVSAIWTHDGAQGLYIGATPDASMAAAEAGTDLDPIQAQGEAHGYLQASVALALLGLTAACEANLYLRSVNTAASLGDGDLEVGEVGPCVPADEDGDGVPDPLEPTEGCTEDVQCPIGGLCVDGVCVFGVPCSEPADCAGDETCGPDHICIAVPGGPCTSTDDCGPLICEGGLCVPCSPGGVQCGPGRLCHPSGKCIDLTGVDGGTGSSPSGGSVLPDAGELRGGAFACALSRTTGWGLAAAVLGALPLALARRRARRSSRRPG